MNNKKVDILQKNIKVDRFSHNLTYYVHGTVVDLPEISSQINKESILIPNLIRFQTNARVWRYRCSWQNIFIQFLIVEKYMWSVERQKMHFTK